LVMDDTISTISKIKKAEEKCYNNALLFEAMPPEIVLQIFSYLKYIDLISLSKTCLKFNLISSDSLLWKEKCFKLWKKLIYFTNADTIYPLKELRELFEELHISIRNERGWKLLFLQRLYLKKFDTAVIKKTNSVTDFSLNPYFPIDSEENYFELLPLTSGNLSVTVFNSSSTFGKFWELQNIKNNIVSLVIHTKWESVILKPQIDENWDNNGEIKKKLRFIDFTEFASLEKKGDDIILDGDFTNKLSDSSQIINDENTSHINVNRTSKLIVKKREIKKDPNAPKRNRSAYMFFCTNKREEVKSANPEATFGTIGKLLGENWKSLDADQKEI